MSNNARPEVERWINLDPVEIQSCVSGEKLKLNVKAELSGYGDVIMLEAYTTQLEARIKELEGELERLKWVLSGDPHLTATKEERSEWRFSDVRYADKLEKENQRLRDRMEVAIEHLKNMAGMINPITKTEYGAKLYINAVGFLSESQKGE